MESSKNFTLKVVALNSPSFLILDGGTRFKGRDFQILQVLSEKLGFNYEILTPKDQIWGNCDDERNCTGLIGFLARKDADIGISSVTASTYRACYVDFSYPYTYDEITFLTKEPATEINAFFVADAMSLDVWLLLFGFLAFTYCLSRLAKLLKFTRNETLEIGTIVAILLRQDLNFKRIENKSRVWLALMTVVIFTGCLTKIYECVITSTTSVSPISKPINTIDDLVNAVIKDGYVVSSLEGDSIEKAVMSAKSGHLKIFADSTNKAGFVAPKKHDEIPDRISTSKFALLAERLFTQKQVSLKNYHWPSEDLHWGVENLYVGHIAVAYRKNFQWKYAANFWLGILVSSGLINKWDSDDVKLTPKPAKEIMNLSYIAFYDLTKVFYGLFLGYLAAFITFCLEKLTFFVGQSIRSKTHLFLWGT